MPRLTNLEHSLFDMLAVMAENNPGAITAMASMVKIQQQTDPQSALKEFGIPMVLDTYGIYGSNIWQLYKDVCSEDAHKMLMLLRATQMGIFSSTKLVQLSTEVEARALFSVDWKWLNEEMYKALPTFKSLDAATLAAV